MITIITFLMLILLYIGVLYIHRDIVKNVVEKFTFFIKKHSQQFKAGLVVGSTLVVAGGGLLLVEPPGTEFDSGMGDVHRFGYFQGRGAVDLVSGTTENFWSSWSSPNYPGYLENITVSFDDIDVSVDIHCALYTYNYSDEWGNPNNGRVYKLISTSSVVNIDAGDAHSEVVFDFPNPPIVSPRYTYAFGVQPDETTSAGDTVEINADDLDSTHWSHYKNDYGSFDDPMGAEICCTIRLHMYGSCTNISQITFAGDTSYDDPVYLQPPHHTGLAYDGYFANGSCIPENCMTIWANLSDAEGVESAKVHWYNMTDDIWYNNTLDLVFQGGCNYSVSTSDNYETVYHSPSDCGDNHNDFSNPTNAYSQSDTYAVEDTLRQCEDYDEFGFDIPDIATITGILVEVDNYDTSKTKPSFYVSKDGGSSWSSAEVQNSIGNSDGDNYEPVGDGSTELWGLSWTGSDFDDGNFYVKVEHNNDKSTLYVDHIRVKVYYSIGLPSFKVGQRHSFDIWYNDTDGNTYTVPWYKNETENVYNKIRRSVYLNCIPMDSEFEYTPWYTWNLSYDLTGGNPGFLKPINDILWQDQRVSGVHDWGYIAKKLPVSETQWTYCGAAIWLPLAYKHDDNANKTCINTTTISDFYLRNWWSNQSTADGANTTEMNMGINKTDSSTHSVTLRDGCYRTVNSTNDAIAVLNITELTQNNWYDNDLTHIQLTCFKQEIPEADSDYFTFDSNSMYQLMYIQSGDCPSAFCNRSYLSYILFNLPDNATLQTMDSDGDSLNDYNELFLNYTSPFHNDTDNDGISDDTEISGGTNPNIYTDIYDEPWIHDPVPADNSMDISVQPTCNITADHNNSNNMDVCFYSNYSDGVSWVLYQKNSSVASGTNVLWSFTGANSYNTTYWWKVTADDGTTNVSETYSFTTMDVYNTTIRNNGEDYFVYLGGNITVGVFSSNITGFDSADEYMAIWDNGTWSSSEGNWKYYYGDSSGTNYTLHTFDVIKIVLSDSGTQNVILGINDAISYETSKTYTWVNNSINQGYNYTGYNNATSITLSSINSSVTLQSGEAIGLWNETNYSWDWWLPGFYEEDRDVHQWDVIISKVEDTETWDT